MNITVSRDLIAQIMIVLAVSIGGWMMLVEPPMREIESLEAEMRTHQSDAPDVDERRFQAAVAQMAAIPKRLKEIEARNAIAGDSTRLYAVIKGLADDYDVVVRRLVGRAQSPSAGSTIMVNRIDLMVEGEYERVARFVSAVEGIDGFIRAASLKISPMQHDGQSLVTAQFTCEARQFPVDAVTALMEGSNAQP